MSKAGIVRVNSFIWPRRSELDFVAINFPAFFRVDLGSSLAAPSI